MTTSQEPGGASRVSVDVRTYEEARVEWGAALDTIERLQRTLDGTRRKSEDYELRAKAAQATLAKVRAWAEDEWPASDEWLTGFAAAQRDLIKILDGKTP